MFAIKPPCLHYGAHFVNFPLPASVDEQGLSMTVWCLSDDDRDKILCGAHVRLWIHTQDDARPVCIEVMDPINNVVHES